MVRALAAVAAASLCLAGASVAGAQGPGASGYAPRFEQAPCPADLPPFPALANARCGYLVVPEDRSRPDGATVRLAVAIVPAVSSQPAPDPLVHLTGGPGGLALFEAQRLVDAGFNRDRDLILLEQRGTKFSQPELTCPVIDIFNQRLLGLRYDSRSTRREHLAATRACRDQLAAGGADLSAYNTTENAADVADLRTALGYDEWNVFGVSYGTDLALTVVRDHPEGIRSVILDSVVPPSVIEPARFWPNLKEGFDNLFAACAAQPACDERYPHLRRTFARLVRRLEAHPVRTTVTDAQGTPTKVVIDGGALVNWLLAQSFFTPNFVNVPQWIDELAHGNPQSIAALRVAQATPPGFVAYGLSFGVICREWTPFSSAQRVLRVGRRTLPKYPDSVLAQPPQLPFVFDDCAAWDVPAAPDSVRAPTISEVPTLLLSGSFDAVTSLEWANLAARTLSNAHVVSIPGVGHFVAPESPCAQAIVASFLQQPQAPDSACAATLEPPAFTTG
jgi:pimeloyl-ACP methyl ester carboxylesterase